MAVFEPFFGCPFEVFRRGRSAACAAIAFRRPFIKRFISARLKGSVLLKSAIRNFGFSLSTSAIWAAACSSSPRWAEQVAR